MKYYAYIVESEVSMPDEGMFGVEGWGDIVEIRTTEGELVDTIFLGEHEQLEMAAPKYSNYEWRS